MGKISPFYCIEQQRILLRKEQETTLHDTQMLKKYVYRFSTTQLIGIGWPPQAHLRFSRLFNQRFRFLVVEILKSFKLFACNFMWRRLLEHTVIIRRLMFPFYYACFTPTDMMIVFH